MTLLVDVFPLSIDLEQYPLSAFKIQGEESLIDEIGAMYAYRAYTIKNITCAWSRKYRILITPYTTTLADMSAVLKELWSTQPDKFSLIDGVEKVENWTAQADALSQFIVRGVLRDINKTIRFSLRNKKIQRGIVIAQRQEELKGIVVNGSPALQITVRSPMRSKKKLEMIYDADNPGSIINLFVECNEVTGREVKGRVIEVSKTLGQLRDKFKEWNPKTYDVSVIDKLPDTHPIVKIETFTGNKYEYPMEVLKIAVDMATLSALKLSQSDINYITRWLKIAPDLRKETIDIIYHSIGSYVEENLPYIQVSERYSAQNFPDNFATMMEIGLNTDLQFKNQATKISKDTQMVSMLKKHGIYKKHTSYSNSNKLLAAVIDLRQNKSQDAFGQLERLQKTLKSLGFELERVADLVSIYAEDSWQKLREMQTSLNALVKQEPKPHIIFIYLPENERYRDSDDLDSLYNTAKRICIGSGIPSQIIFEDTVSVKWADDNIIMGIIGKTGNVPYILAHPLTYCDVVVGLDVSRTVKKGTKGTMSFAALSRVYTNHGALLGYRAGTDMAIEAEIIPRHVLETVLPEEEFGGKRVVIHRDGNLVGNEYQNLMDWAKQIGAEFYPVEVIKSGASRIYRNTSQNISQAKKSDIFYLSDSKAYVISSPPVYGKSTARPLQIRNRSILSMENAIHSVMALTLLHYGSVRSTRLPVSTHSSDKIAGFLTRNINPRDEKGDIPFWL